MIAVGHFAKRQIEQRLNDLEADWTRLKAEATSRQKKLQDALESQRVGEVFILCAPKIKLASV